VIHFCPTELIIILSSLPFFKVILKPCCAQLLKRFHDHRKAHKNIINLSPEEQKQFAKTLENPPEPNEALKDAYKKHRKETE